MDVSREDYLKAIYELGGDKHKVGTKSIATSLRVSQPSVSEMIKKLVKEGYVDYELYKGVALTPQGLERAKRVKRRHLLWEVFLVEKLGYNWEDVHDEAEILEHVTSRELEERLDQYLDYPATCPHGSPIVSSTGYRGPNDESPLSDITVGQRARIIRFSDERTVLQYVRQVGLTMGDLIDVKEKDQAGPVVSLKGQEVIVIPKELANKIYVKQGEKIDEEVNQ